VRRRRFDRRREVMEAEAMRRFVQDATSKGKC
jgi:hypothetical protein